MMMTRVWSVLTKRRTVVRVCVITCTPSQPLNAICDNARPTCTLDYSYLTTNRSLCLVAGPSSCMTLELPP